MKKIDGDSSEVVVTRVELGDHSYEILIGSESLDRFGSSIRRVWDGRKIHIVTNLKVGGLYGGKVIDSIQAAGFEAGLITIPDGESFKNLDTVNQIYTELLEAGADRGTGLVALGGGVTGDITGFAAATFMRGISYFQVPTTLLAQVDSSVGGKTGVNHLMGKNLIGAFCQPALVYIDIKTLQTLAKKDFKSGLYEVIKYGLIRDRDFFNELSSNMDRIKRIEQGLMKNLIRRCCEIKAEVVAEDEKEAGTRRILNFGHTFGHALEAVTSYRTVTHGEAVGYGMIAASCLSFLRGYIDQKELDLVISGVLSVGDLPPIGPVSGRDIVSACGRDKKKKGDRLVFVLLDGIGNTVIQEFDLSDEHLEQAWRFAREAVAERLN